MAPVSSIIRCNNLHYRCVKPQKRVPPIRENHYSIWVFQTGEETPLQASGAGIVEKRRGIAAPPECRARRASTVREQPVTVVD